MSPAQAPIVESLRRQAACRPDHVALVVGGQEITYARLWRFACSATGWLARNGVTPQTTVIVPADSRDPHFPAIYFGIHLCRAIAIPVDPRVGGGELRELAERVNPVLTLVGEELNHLRSALDNEADDEAVLPGDSPSLSDIAEVVFTTGSTGRPKGVILSHANIAASATLIAEFIGNTADDREVVTVPLTHSFGLGRLRSSLLAGGTLILVPGLTFPQQTLAALTDYEATGLAAVPAGVEILMARGGETLRKLAHHIRYVEMGSAPMRRESKERLMQLLPTTRICMHYGLTEASRSAFIEFHGDASHLDTVGRASPGVEIRIVDEAGRPASTGSRGSIQVRADTVMAGYWQDRDATERVIDPDGWLTTGDLGSLDEHGYLSLAGRSDDVINLGGEKIMPEEIERVVRQIDGIRDCGCAGVSDPEGLLGQIPLICIVTDNDDIDDAALRRHLLTATRGRVQKAVVRRTDALPRTESGKLLRRKLASHA